MARKITDSCISCGSCADVCPEGAVREGKNQYVIDPSKCKDCGKCEDGCAENAVLSERSQPYERVPNRGLSSSDQKETNTRAR